MKRVLLIGSTLLFTTTVVVAQSSAPSAAPAQPSSNIVLAIAPPGAGCPVSMHALQGSGSGLLRTRNQPPVNGFAQSIHLILGSWETGSRKTARVVSAKIVVQGYSGKARMEQASSEQTGDRNRTIDVSFTPEGKDVAADLLLPGFTAVSSIRLESITYSDGSTWKVGGEQACRVAPDPLMLVDAAKAANPNAEQGANR